MYSSVPDTWSRAGVLQAAEPEGLPERRAKLTLTRVRCYSVLWAWRTTAAAYTRTRERSGK